MGGGEERGHRSSRGGFGSPDRATQHEGLRSVEHMSYVVQGIPKVEIIEYDDGIFFLFMWYAVSPPGGGTLVGCPSCYERSYRPYPL